MASQKRFVRPALQPSYSRGDAREAREYAPGMSSTYISTSRRPLAETDFCIWVGQAAPGDILEYHRGFLGIDIELGPRPVSERKALRQLARRAAWAFDVGLVHLVQRRNGSDDFCYFAIKRPRPPLHARVKPKPDATLLDSELEQVA